MIFVDTSAWFASIVPSNSDHLIAAQWLQQNSQTLLTTDYVVNETLTLLRARSETVRALSLGSAFFSGTLAKLYYLTEADIQQTWQVFRQFSDKNWSFTDCSSKVVIEQIKITQAFSFDHHFHQFGSTQVFP
jgi:uncharacterized protein